MNNPVFFGAAGDERGTPQVLFDALHREFHFDLDAAATPANAKCELFFGEGGIAQDALVEDWGGSNTTVFLNPPYSQVGAFVSKAREEADEGARVVLLLPVRSDTKWWHRVIWDREESHWRPGIAVRFLPGRLNFELHVSTTLRTWIKSELSQIAHPKAFQGGIQMLVRATGLPRMAIERIYLDQPDETLLDSAPFPSCVVIMTGVERTGDVSPLSPLAAAALPDVSPAVMPRLKRKYTRRQGR